MATSMEESTQYLTDEVEVALFCNDSLAVAAFLHACKDDMVSATSSQYRRDRDSILMRRMLDGSVAW
jgi:hypothetical protein